MNLQEWENKVEEFNVVIENEVPIINARITRTALSLVKDRIINKGIDGNGKSFGKYSTNPLPTFFFLGKSLGSRADSTVKKIAKDNYKQGIKGVSYEQFRQANNLQTNHVDLKFSGDTLRDIDVLETKTDGNKITTIAASKDSISKRSGNSTIKTGRITELLGDRYGDFLTVSEEEQSILSDSLDDELQLLIDNTFGK